MKSPAEMKVVQIDITNVCHRSCSNCTRFCGHHAKPFQMDVATFQKAVDSMEGFPGIVGIMGGEPTLHPQFSEMLDYYAKHIPEPRPGVFIGEPVPSFQHYSRTVKYMRGRHRGLWSSLGEGYYRNFEQIQDVFPFQVLNDHRTVNRHQAILITRKELGIPDDEWIKLRDQCWIQNLWSASITPKGAFFCEIAASLDMLFDGPGGWPLEKGWWRRKPSEFGDQLRWCEMCSVALNVPTMSADDNTDIVSPAMLEKLQKINGPKIRNHKYVVLDLQKFDRTKMPGHEHDPIWFLPADQRDEARVSPTNLALMPKHIEIAVREGASEQATLTRAQVEALEFTDWVAVFRNEAAISSEFIANAKQCVLNPGCLYCYDNDVWLFHRRARALRQQTGITLDEKLAARWDPKKRIAVANYPQIGRLNLRQKLGQRFKQAYQRGAFLLPEFITRSWSR